MSQAYDAADKLDDKIRALGSVTLDEAEKAVTDLRKKSLSLLDEIANLDADLAAAENERESARTECNEALAEVESLQQQLTDAINAQE